MSKGNIQEMVDEHERLRRGGINLIPSENRQSPAVRRALTSDLGARYHAPLYGGTGIIRDIIAATEDAARRVYGVRHAFVTPLSGNVCDVAMVLGFTEPGDSCALLGFDRGGYPLGLGQFGRKPAYLKADPDTFGLDVPGSAEVVRKSGAPLTMLGASFIPFPHPVKEMRSALDDGGIDTTLVYDASHVLGLIGCGEFQDPLGEGAEIMFGSTHKTLFGPQGGIVLTNSKEHHDRLYPLLELHLETGIGLVDNPHVNRIAALGVALEELEADRGYGGRVIANARALAAALADLDVPLRFASRGYTASHKLMMDVDGHRGARLCADLESVGIFADVIGRLGTAECTRLGMGPSEMERVAALVAIVYHQGPSDEVSGQVGKLAMEFPGE